MNKTFSKIILIIPLIIVIAGFGYFLKIKSNELNSNPILPLTLKNSTIKINRFNSDSELKDYLVKNQAALTTGFDSIRTNGIAPEATGTMKSLDNIGIAGGSAERISTTNVQIIGIDEPDIVKTDGQNIYFSRTNNFIFTPLNNSKDVSSSMMPPQNNLAGIQTIKALPPTKIELGKTIDDQGEMLIANKNLLVFGNNKLTGYDISNPLLPLKKWSINYNENNFFEAARLYNNQIYLVTKKTAVVDQPCPFEPFSGMTNSLIIKCNDIYYPSTNINADTFYSISIINPDSGEINQATTFLGSAASSIVYMSKDNLYLTYFYSGDYINYILGFFKDNPDLAPTSITIKLERLQGYDISTQAKMTELQTLISQMVSSMTNDERLKFNNDFANKIIDYQNLHLRELEFTGIAKFSTKDLSLQASGVIPGRLLNQFSLDEFENNLRVATTIGNNNSYIGLPVSRSATTNDVYILDEHLNIIGSALDLGKSEQIYSIRFINNRGYLVTFKQTDPFFILDLSNPRVPKMTGELKIPGFSSYLHPLADNLILGIGQENNQVKVSLFDVSQSDNPIEVDKYNLDEYWTEVQNNYHAFLQDDQHQIFFLPGSKGGYIFSYNSQKLNLVKAVSTDQLKRALYLNNYLYLVGDNNISVFNENNWQKIGELSLPVNQIQPVVRSSGSSTLSVPPSPLINKIQN